MIVRDGTDDDADALLALESLLFEADAWSLPMVVSELAADDRVVLVAVDEGELVGYAVTLCGVDVADLHRIGVHPRSQRTGVAGALLDASLARAGERGAARMLLEVSARNDPAIALYERAGFAEIDRRRRYYRDGSDALVLARELDGRPHQM